MIKTINNFSRLCCLTVVFLVGACGGSKTVVTQDDSAEYRTAKSLPPLRKPQKTQGATSPASGSTPSSAPISTPVDRIEAAPVTTVPIESAENIREQLIDDSATDKQELPSVNTVPDTIAVSEQEALSATVVEVGTAAKLRINSDFDQAWSYLSQNLRDSDITVHNRNQAAGRFSIGCSKIGEVSEVKKAGRWSIFKRNKTVESEYCSLQATSNKGSTMVSVHNRSGLEVSGDDAKAIFARLLNN